MPLHLLDLGGFALARVPGEPTTLAARQNDEHVRAVPGMDEVVGDSGDDRG